MTNLQKRIIAAAIYFPFLLLCTWNVWSFAIVLTFFAAVSWYEYLHFFPDYRSKKLDWKIGIWIVLGSLPLVFLVFEWPVAWAGLALLLVWQLAAIVSLFRGKSFAEFLNDIQLMSFGFIYITALYTCLGLLHQQVGGPEAVWFLLFVVGASDTGAYFVGRFFGQTPFFAFVSPNKTREGFLGGLVLAILVAIFVNWLLATFDFYSLSYWKAALLGAVVSVFSSFGDLVESSIKRNFGVKESGKIIAGHGGILDRFDGVIYAALPLLIFVVLNQGFMG